MTPSLLDQFTEACNYPGKLDEAAVEKHLQQYVSALGIKRNIVRIRAGWELSDYPDLQKNIALILDDFSKRNPDAIDAIDAIDARDAGLKRFTAWCIQTNGWSWWRWEVSYLASTYLGATQNQKETVKKWSEPVFHAFLEGAWLLYWTEHTLYWVAKPAVHHEIGSGEKRLHNDNYAALESDCENIYFWHGVLVPAFVVVRPDWITIKHIETELKALI